MRLLMRNVVVVGILALFFMSCGKPNSSQSSAASATSLSQALANVAQSGYNLTPDPSTANFNSNFTSQAALVNALNQFVAVANQQPQTQPLTNEILEANTLLNYYSGQAL